MGINLQRFVSKVRNSGTLGKQIAGKQQNVNAGPKAESNP